MYEIQYFYIVPSEVKSSICDRFMPGICPIVLLRKLFLCSLMSAVSSISSKVRSAVWNISKVTWLQNSRHDHIYQNNTLTLVSMLMHLYLPVMAHFFIAALCSYLRYRWLILTCFMVASSKNWYTIIPMCNPIRVKKGQFIERWNVTVWNTYWLSNQEFRCALTKVAYFQFAHDLNHLFASW